MAWIQDPLKKRIHWTSVVLAVAGWVAWGLIAHDFRWAFISFAVFFGIRIAIFQYLDFRAKKRGQNGRSRMTPLPNAAVLVRTWFGSDDAWESLLLEVHTPSAEGFLANVVPVDEPAWEGLSAEALQAEQTTGPFVSFLADETTLTSVEHPILAVWVFADGDGGYRDHRSFRVVPAALWSVENNINLANMDWPEFTSSVGKDGVFYGF